jgi:eukaryotic-like serine/threonine-protein kinase
MPVAGSPARVGGRYRLDSKLASGGMGTVWRGWDERLQRPVAVKTFHLQPWLTTAERDDGIKRAMREARLTARLHHTNAVQVFDVVENGDGPCLIMEYVPSRSLQQIVDEQGPLSPVEVARIGTQVAAALAAAHRVGIVHRDVKPGNVLIDEDGLAKITDFGISHAFDDITVTSTGMLTGTPAYLAPEVARGGASDFASDVYSLGATLYMAVEGKPPFGDDPNPMAVLHRVASGAWEPPSRSGPLTPTLASMMSADPAVRPSMVEVANALPAPAAATPERSTGATTQVIARRPQTSPAATPVPAGGTRVVSAPPPSVGHPPKDRRRRRSWWAILAAVIVVALAGVLAAILLSRPGGNNNNAAGPSSATTPRSTPATTPPTTAPSSTSASTRNAAPSTQDLANAVVDYFKLVPGDLDAGWARLTPHFQSTKAQNRQTYFDYWNTVERVDVSNARGVSPDRATATLTYHYKNGPTITEQTQFRLVQQDGVLKIDGES